MWVRMLAFVLCGGAFASQVLAYSVEITEAEMQTMVAAVFPVSQQSGLVDATFSDPRVRITSRQRIRLSLACQIKMPMQSAVMGRATIEGELHFDAQRGEFQLRYPALVSVNFATLPAEYNELVKGVISTVTEQQLPIVVLYRLDDKDLRQAMARRVLRGIVVKDGKLIAEIDF